MTVSFSLRQITSVETGPLYRVANSITAATGANSSVFVYKTITQGFSHYATPADMEAYPTSYAAADTDGLAFYRQTSVTRDWETIEQMNSDVSLTQSRIQLLASQLAVQQGALASDTTTVIVGEE